MFDVITAYLLANHFESRRRLDRPMDMKVAEAPQRGPWNWRLLGRPRHR